MLAERLGSRQRAAISGVSCQPARRADARQDQAVAHDIPTNLALGETGYTISTGASMEVSIRAKNGLDEMVEAPRSRSL